LLAICGVRSEWHFDPREPLLYNAGVMQ
jgi:hypothetical protein